MRAGERTGIQRGFGRIFGDNVDGAVEGVGAIQDGPRPANDFNVFDRMNRESRVQSNIDPTESDVAVGSAVDQQQHVIVFVALQIAADRGHVALEHEAASHKHAGGSLQYFIEILGTELLDIVGRDHVHDARRFGQ